MESLFEALYTYAQKNCFDIYALRNAEEWQENETMIRRAMEELKLRGMGDAAERLEDGYSVLACLDRRGAFWSGLAIGMELNRF